MSEYNSVPIARWIDRDRLVNQPLLGSFLNAGSPVAAEIAASVGFDWLMIDLEHGNATDSDLPNLLRSLRGSQTSPLVRVPTLAPEVVKFALDQGAAGIMFPQIQSVEQAEAAVASMKYPPDGNRGAAGMVRASDYGNRREDYFNEANAKTLCIVQIEEAAGLESVRSIAEVKGIDVLFVGPLDLSFHLGCPGDMSDARLLDACQRVVDACDETGKVPGIFSGHASMPTFVKQGFRFVGIGSDANSVMSGMKNSLRLLQQMTR